MGKNCQIVLNLDISCSMSEEVLEKPMPGPRGLQPELHACAICVSHVCHHKVWCLERSGFCDRGCSRSLFGSGQTWVGLQ